ncbi:hypothetical protein, partial [Candidatus Binatus sp.]|uniref:hypothetical protein n=1 Tax=Candidatus Binatus sp. TaxID=2811406 RepID=UPI003CC51718
MDRASVEAIAVDGRAPAECDAASVLSACLRYATRTAPTAHAIHGSRIAPTTAAAAICRHFDRALEYAVGA